MLLLWDIFIHNAIYQGTYSLKNSIFIWDWTPVPKITKIHLHHSRDVILGTIAFQIIGVSIVYSTVCSGVDQRKHQSSASLAYVRGIHRWPVNSPHKGQLRGKCFHLMKSSNGNNISASHLRKQNKIKPLLALLLESYQGDDDTLTFWRIPVSWMHTKRKRKHCSTYFRNIIVMLYKWHMKTNLYMKTLSVLSLLSLSLSLSSPSLH